MDMLLLLRTLGGLGVVLGILAGALWLVRRYDLRLPGRAVTARDRRLELVETLPIDARRTIALVRRDGHEHLVLIAPEGHLVLENAIIIDAADQAAAVDRRTARVEAALLRDAQRQQRWPDESFSAAASGSFAALIERVGVNRPPRSATPMESLDRAAAASRAMIESTVAATRKMLAKAVARASIVARARFRALVEAATRAVAAANARAVARAATAARARAAKAASQAVRAATRATQAAEAAVAAQAAIPLSAPAPCPASVPRPPPAADAIAVPAQHEVRRQFPSGSTSPGSKRARARRQHRDQREKQHA